MVQALKIAFFPWIALKRPITICGVEILPRSIAIERAGALGDSVAAATSYFYDDRFEGAPEFGHPKELVKLEPSIVLLDNTTMQRLEIAKLVWIFSVIFANDDMGYANSTTFQHFYQHLTADSLMIARRTRRMHGFLLNGSLASTALATKPHWCGTYHDPDEDVLQLLELVIDVTDASYIREALDALRLATKDDDSEPAEAEHAHYARAFERLLHRAGQPRTGRRAAQTLLAKRLLSTVMPVGSIPQQILNVREAVIDRRNDFWHPEGAMNPKYAFEKQGKVHPNLIAFRALSVLFIASCRELVGGPLADRLEVYPRAVDEWMSGICENDPRDAREASHIGLAWSDALWRLRIERIVAQAPAAAAAADSTP